MKYVTAESVESPEAKCQELLGDWLDHAGMEAAFPMELADVARLLRDGAEYDIDEHGLRKLQSLGMIPDVAFFDGREIVAVAGALEGRRQFLPNSSHKLKQTHWQQCLDSHLEAGEEGLEHLRGVLRNVDLRLALLLLTEADSREVREKLFTTVQALLAIEGLRI